MKGEIMIQRLLAEHLDGRGLVPFIGCEGKRTVKRPLGFRHWQPDDKVFYLGRELAMADVIRPSVVAWWTSSLLGTPFDGGNGRPDPDRPWLIGDDFAVAEQKADATTALAEALGVRYIAFHAQGDLIKPVDDFAQDTDRILRVVGFWKQHLGNNGRRRKVLWVTPNNFSRDQFRCGGIASTSARAAALAAAHTRVAADIAVDVEAEGFVLWRGKCGDRSLHTTDIKADEEHTVHGLQMTEAHLQKIGFKGGRHIEPKPIEPSRGQHDRDVIWTIERINRAQLPQTWGVNIEGDHARLAGLLFPMEILRAGAHNRFNSVDVNASDHRVGYDVDHFMRSIIESAEMWLAIMRVGGFRHGGGCNFDSHEPHTSPGLLDLVAGHVLQLDALAAGLKVACAIWEDGVVKDILDETYDSADEWAEVFPTGSTLESVEAWVRAQGAILPPKSAPWDRANIVINDYVEAMLAE